MSLKVNNPVLISPLSFLTDCHAIALDPGNRMLLDYLQNKKPSGNRNHILELAGKTGGTSKYLAASLSDFIFYVFDESEQLLSRGEKTLPAELSGRVKFVQGNLSSFVTEPASSFTYAIIVKNVLWCLPDHECIVYLQSLRNSTQVQHGATILINELLSPKEDMPGIHDYHPYRRRDVTLMTMHNAKQRDEDEWRAIFDQVEPGLEVSQVLNIAERLVLTNSDRLNIILLSLLIAAERCGS